MAGDDLTDDDHNAIRTSIEFRQALIDGDLERACDMVSYATLGGNTVEDLRRDLGFFLEPGWSVLRRVGERSCDAVRVVWVFNVDESFTGGMKRTTYPIDLRYSCGEWLIVQLGDAEEYKV